RVTPSVRVWMIWPSSTLGHGNADSNRSEIQKNEVLAVRPSRRASTKCPSPTANNPANHIGSRHDGSAKTSTRKTIQHGSASPKAIHQPRIERSRGKEFSGDASIAARRHTSNSAAAGTNQP